MQPSLQLTHPTLCARFNLNGTRSEILISLHNKEDPIFGIDVVPFLATSYDEARKLWAASKPTIERKLAPQGLMVLFAVPWPPQASS